MNKVMVVKNFALRGFNDVRQNPQKYIYSSLRRLNQLLLSHVMRVFVLLA